MTLLIRPARDDDAPGMCGVLNAIIAAGGTTAHRRPFDADRMRAHYIAPPLGILCSVAADGDEVLGFQALSHADPDYPAVAKLGPDWGIIASFVGIGAQGRGIGHRLFAATEIAARRAGLTAIDATIRRENAGGLKFYESLGFRTYMEGVEAVSKRFDL